MLTRLVVLVVLVGCKGGEKKDSPKPPPPSVASGTAAGSGTAAPPKPAFATPEAKLARYKECVAAFNSANTEVLAGCYTADAIREQVDSVPELASQGSQAIVDMVVAQRASFPDLTITPRIIVVSGSTIAALLHVTGKNTVAAGGMKATNKKLGVFEAEIATIEDDGKISRDSFYVDQPTVYHQLGLLANDTSPGPIDLPAGDTEIAISKNDAAETANKAIAQKTLDAMSAKDPAAIEAQAADDVKFTYHGEKQKIETKKAYMKWMRDMMASTEESKVEVKGIWAAGDFVVVADVFTGTPTKEVAGEGRQIKTNVVQIFRIEGGKIKQHQIFANRLNTAVQLGFVDPEQLMQTLSAASK